MTPAPYNRATLNLMRQGVTASQLGWEEQRYARVCRAHGIERAGAALPSVVREEHKPMTAAQAMREPVVKHIAPKPKPTPAAPAIPIPEGDPHWYYSTKSFCCGSACVSINAPMQVKIMCLLFYRYCIDRDDMISGVELAQIIGTGRASTRGHIWTLTQKIKPLGWCINGNKRRGGGYNLARVQAAS